MVDIANRTEDVTLYDESGNKVAIISDGSIYRLATSSLSQVRDVSGVATDVGEREEDVLMPCGIMDEHRKTAQMSAFGVLKTANESILGDYRYNSTDVPLDFDITTTGTGSYSLENTNTLVLNTGASSSSKIQLDSERTHYYQSGRGQMFKTSIILGDTGVAGNIREWGYGNDNNGLFIRMDGTDLKFVIKTNGVETEELASNWDTPVTPDANGHLWYIQFEWLGVGNVYIYYDEKIVHTHRFLGTDTNVSIAVPDLPIRFRNENTTNTTDVYMKSGCSSVVMEGGMVISGQSTDGQIYQARVDEQGNLFTIGTDPWEYASVNNLAFATSFGASFAGGTVEQPFMLIKNPAGSGYTCRFKRLTLAVTTNTLGTFRLYRQPTITANGTVNPIGCYREKTATGVVEAYSVPTYSATGNKFLQYDLNAGGVGIIVIEQGLSLILLEGDELLITLEQGSNNNKFSCNISWAEELIL